MFLCIFLSVPIPAASQPNVPLEPVANNSGHHFAFGTGRDDARIGLDFGRNPYSDRSVSFATGRGRGRLDRALRRAVENGETRMSFDFGFDFRSVVVADGDTLRLDREVLPSIQAFLEAVEAANRRAQEAYRRRFRADVVLTDYRMADGISRENGSRVGEHPEFFLQSSRRAALMAALKPAFEVLGRHPLVTLNLMNEPEFISFPASKAVAFIEEGRWRRVELAQDLRADLARRKVGGVQGVKGLLRGMGKDAYVRVVKDRAAGKVTLAQTPILPSQVDAFLLAMHGAVLSEAPNTRLTIGWADDESALHNTVRLEQQAGGVVTHVISLHVYGVPENSSHPLRRTRRDFETAGLDGRSIRITEWGLGGARTTGFNVRGAILNALERVRDAGFDGVLFWWDREHTFNRQAYGEALQAFVPFGGQEILPKSPDFDRDGMVGFSDFVAFALQFGARRGGPTYDARFDLDRDGEVGFGDFLAFAEGFGQEVNKK